MSQVRPCFPMDQVLRHLQSWSTWCYWWRDTTLKGLWAPVLEERVCSTGHDSGPDGEER
jgi:hypothetical protein